MGDTSVSDGVAHSVAHGVGVQQPSRRVARYLTTTNRCAVEAELLIFTLLVNGGSVTSR